MSDEDWIKILEDGKKVKFIYQELPDDGAFTGIAFSCIARSPERALGLRRLPLLRLVIQCGTESAL
jgi:hypothetical protein